MGKSNSSKVKFTESQKAQAEYALALVEATGPDRDRVVNAYAHEYAGVGVPGITESDTLATTTGTAASEFEARAGGLRAGQSGAAAALARANIGAAAGTADALERVAARQRQDAGVEGMASMAVGETAAVGESLTEAAGRSVNDALAANSRRLQASQAIGAGFQAAGNYVAVGEAQRQGAASVQRTPRRDPPTLLSHLQRPQ